MENKNTIVVVLLLGDFPGEFLMHPLLPRLARPSEVTGLFVNRGSLAGWLVGLM